MPNEKEGITIKTEIKRGPTTDYQRSLWRRWWAKLINQAKGALESEDEVKNGKTPT